MSFIHDTDDRPSYTYVSHQLQELHQGSDRIAGRGCDGNVQSAPKRGAGEIRQYSYRVLAESPSLRLRSPLPQRDFEPGLRQRA